MTTTAIAFICFLLLNVAVVDSTNADECVRRQRTAVAQFEKLFETNISKAIEYLPSRFVPPRRMQVALLIVTR